MTLDVTVMAAENSALPTLDYIFKHIEIGNSHFKL